MTVDFLRSRHSVRSFTAEPLSAEAVKSIKAEITMINTHEAGMHFELVCDDPSPFSGFKASYGMFKGVRNYVAAVADISFPDAYERAGYFGEQIAMKAVSLGLGTCFVAGTFDASKVKVVLRVDRKILFIIALGYPAEKKQTFMSSMAMKMAHLHDKDAYDFFVPGSDPDYSLDDALADMPWLENGLKGLACAPSSLNRQPVRIKPVETDPFYSGERMSVAAFVSDSADKNLIDLGIGKFNFAEAAGGVWEWGNGAVFYHSGGEELS